MTKEQVELLKHAIGFYSDTPFYRNFFSTWPNSEADKLWLSIVEEGYGEWVRNSDYRVYRVTKKGIDFLKELKEEGCLDNPERKPLGVHLIEENLNKGKTISVPSLDIKIKKTVQIQTLLETNSQWPILLKKPYDGEEDIYETVLFVNKEQAFCIEPADIFHGTRMKIYEISLKPGSGWLRIELELFSENDLIIKEIYEEENVVI